jgi:hypothetical protein
MTLNEANLALDAIVEKNRDTVYCRAKRDRYGKPIVIHMEGEFTPGDLRLIATISAEMVPA